MHGFLDENEANQAFQALDQPESSQEGGGEIAYQQWYHMPDAKKEKKGKIEPLKPLTRIKVAQTAPPEEDKEGKIWMVERPLML